MGSNHPLSVRTERRMDKQEIRDKSSQDNSNILLLEKGKRGALNVIFGRTMLIVVLILAQILLLRRDFERRQLTQILVSFLFGFYTDLTMWITGFLQVPFDLPLFMGYPLRFLELMAGGAILAFGIACEVRCDSLMLAGEGFPLAISKFVKKDFGRVKMCSDTGLVCVAVVFMFCFFGHWDWKMVGVGTLFSMFYVGFMVRVFSPHIAWLDIIFIPRAERIEELCCRGIEGLEVFYPQHDEADTARYLDMAKRYQLLVTGGSDYHGFATRYPQDLGVFTIDDCWAEKLYRPAQKL